MALIDFAVAMPATKIENLLELATPYLTYVKGIQNFSGPGLIILLEQDLTAGFDIEAIGSFFIQF
jgi:hypothetical protein